MADFIRVTPDFAVAPQLSADDFARAAQEGFTRVLNNRPEGEAPDQLAGASAEAAAKAAGLAYAAIPIVGGPSPPTVEAAQAYFGETAGPTLAYCRSGTRSITLWAFAEVRAKRRTPEDVVSLARAAGYDLRPHLPILSRLAEGG